MIIELLYPEITGLYGDMGNIRYLQRSAPDAEVVRTGMKARPYFADNTPDLIYLCSMTESAQGHCAAALRPYRERILELIDGGTAFLITGNALELFGTYIDSDDGAARIEGLGIFDTHAERRMLDRYNGLYWGKLGDEDVFGFKSQFSHSYGEGGDGLFTTVRGAGRSPGVIPEGFRRNNFMATYLLGPLLVINPPFTMYLLRLLGIDHPQLAFERAAMAAYERRREEFTDPKTGFEY